MADSGADDEVRHEVPLNQEHHDLHRDLCELVDKSRQHGDDDDDDECSC